MSKQKADYEALLAKITRSMANSPEELKRWLDQGAPYLDALEEMTKDEWSLIAAYVKRDMSEFRKDLKESQESSFTDSPFYQLVSDSIWAGLADITDKTQVEWHELTQDLEHHGVYHAGEMIGFGRLCCESCHWQKMITYPEVIDACPECGCQRFHRKSFEP
ncbi:hypothetical protein VST7929_01932 [Vibrio stylophorae]|uniref:Zinc ribbon-containing protein n=1 Tax=Vibrio stylophorae TaxID=659351 RepID=A0ABM8ZUN1_9VIBR|nr:zinc ribbon-containing protein [Vibrio stylophorae]CAH0534031.1 hypothetical protein VST7929_01932 [Vibrio stylophorae]